MILIAGAIKSGEAVMYRLVLALLGVLDDPALRSRQAEILRWRDVVSPSGLLRADPAAVDRVINLPNLALRVQGTLTEALAHKLTQAGARIIRVERAAEGIAGAILRHATHTRLFDDPENSQFQAIHSLTEATKQAQQRSMESWASLPHALTLQFENLVARPAETLEALAAFLGIDTQVPPYTASLNALSNLVTAPLATETLPGEFHGLIYAQGYVSAIETVAQGWMATVKTYAPAPVQTALRKAGLVAHDGVALAITEVAATPDGGTAWRVTANLETTPRWQIGDLLNLEPISAFGDELGGQTARGRPTGSAILKSRRTVGSRQILRLDIDQMPVARFLPNQSFLMDGISLTVAQFVENREITINVKEHTLYRTTLASWPIGRRVKLEPDALSSIFFAPRVG